jgi:hypothetical protein
MFLHGRSSRADCQVHILYQGIISLWVGGFTVEHHILFTLRTVIHLVQQNKVYTATN